MMGLMSTLDGKLLNNFSFLTVIVLEFLILLFWV